MSRLDGMNATDRIGDVAGQLERGEPVDWGRLPMLQVTDIARAGRAALLDAIDREKEADEQFRQFLEE